MSLILLAQHLSRRWGTLRPQPFHRLRSRRILIRRYETIHGSRKELKNPKTFSAKLFVRMLKMLTERNPQLSTYTDKLQVRDYVRKCVGSDILVPLYWHGSDPKKIPYMALPNQFAIKTTHGCGQVMVVDSLDKFDIDSVARQLKEWLSINYYWMCREIQYYPLIPQIMVEMRLEEEMPFGLLNYRFFCFNGKPLVIQVDNCDHSINPFFDPDWKLLDLWYRPGAQRPRIAKPALLSDMLSIASRLSQPFDFVRVDLYALRGQIYFGELTFTPVGGKLVFNDPQWDLLLGSEWR